MSILFLFTFGKVGLKYIFAFSLELAYYYNLFSLKFS